MNLDLNQPTVANFVQKSFEIISNEENNHIIQWLISGKQFIIKDTELFESVILPHYFRHRNINSFIRQLNMYGFHKSRKQPTKNIFSHPNFLKGRPDILINVRRKLKEQKNDENLICIKKVKSESSNNFMPIVKEQKQLKVNNNQQIILSREMLRSRQNLEMNLQKKQKELQKTAIKTNEPLVSFCSLAHIQEYNNINHSQNHNQKSSDWPFRSLIQKSVIMQLNPQIYAMKYQNITSLNHIDEIEFDFGGSEMRNQVDEIEKQRKRLNNRMVGYNILQTINFMSEFQL